MAFLKFTSAVGFSFLLAGAAVFAAVGEKSPVPGWVVSPTSKDYTAGIDRSVRRSGRASGTIKSAGTRPEQFGNLMQTFSVGIYRGKRVRLTGYLRTVDAGTAQLWLRVDGPDGPQAFDNMDNRPLTGSFDWLKCELVLNVPVDAVNVSFGCLLRGAGQVWCDDLRFEIVGSGVAVTNSGIDATRAGEPDSSVEAAGGAPLRKPSKNAQPKNLGFEDAI